MDFHKDEVRVLGEALGLPKDLVNRHPFPGIYDSSPLCTSYFLNEATL